MLDQLMILLLTRSVGAVLTILLPARSVGVVLTILLLTRSVGAVLTILLLTRSVEGMLTTGYLLLLTRSVGVVLTISPQRSLKVLPGSPLELQGNLRFQSRALLPSRRLYSILRQE